MAKTLALLPLLRLAQSRRDAFEIAKAAYTMGRAKSDAECFERGRAEGWRERDALLSVVRQGTAPSREAATA